MPVSLAEAPTRHTVHASAVVWQDRGILIMGPSGSGKSDLALRLIEAGAMLVADDLVAVIRRDGALVARPVAMPGLIELRGQGIYRLPTSPEARLDLALRLAPAGGTPRLPEPETTAILGVMLPTLAFDAHHVSAVARLRVALAAERVA